MIERDCSSPEYFRDISRQLVINVVGSFLEKGGSKARGEVYSEEVWQRIEWASRALLDALHETKRAKPRRKPKAKVIAFTAKQTA